MRQKTYLKYGLSLICEQSPRKNLFGRARVFVGLLFINAAVILLKALQKVVYSTRQCSGYKSIMRIVPALDISVSEWHDKA